MWSVLGLMLALSLSLSLGSATEPGCQDWNTNPASLNTVCCNRCKPGNRVVADCGKDPVALCTVCENGTYISGGAQTVCHRCRECTGLMRVKQTCTASSDTVCECVEGYRCGDDQCSYCVKECSRGQQPSHNRGCDPCPAGTFNNKIHKFCIKWSSRCPFPDQKIMAKGTAISDIICGPVDDQKPTKAPLPDPETTKIPPNSKDDSLWTTLAIVFTCGFLIICAAVPLMLAFTYRSRQEKTDLGPELGEAHVGWRQTPEPEQCSFCFPQEEHGSSSELSLVSDDKPFGVVV